MRNLPHITHQMDDDIIESKRRKLSESKINIEDELDQVLYLEEQYYQEGFAEGQEESTRQQYLEGKEYGYQTGFQRFIIVGYIRGLLEVWSQNIDSYENKKSIMNHLQQCFALVGKIPTSNRDEDVSSYDTLINKVRNKIRIIASLVKEQSKVNNIDDLVKTIGGQMQLSENVDDMW